MPGMDGTEVVHQLQEDSRTSQIPIIFLTALKGKDDGPLDIYKGPNVIFGKPFNARALIEKIQELTGE